MLYFILAALWFCAAGALASAFGRRLEECLAPAALSAILLLYLAGLAGPLRPGVWLVLGCGAGCAALLCWRLAAADPGQKKLLPARLFTPGALIAAVMVLYIFWAHTGRVVTGNDEFSHWAFAVKQMLHWDTLAIRHAGEMLFPDYPPAAALWEYLFARLLPRFAESSLYRALGLLQLALLLPFLANFGWKRFGGAAAGFLAVFLLPLAFYGEFYTDLCIDGLLALLFAWVLFVWFGGGRQPDGFALLCLSEGCAVLALTKASGLVLALAALGLTAWDAAARRQPTLSVPAALRPLAWPLGALVLARGSWAVLCRVCLGAGGGGGFLQHAASLLSPWPEQYSITLRSFLRVLLLPPEPDAPLRLSPALWLVTGLVLLWAAGRAEPDGMGRLRLGLGLGFGGYCLGLLYLYFFHFSEYEGRRVLSAARYLGSWLLAMALLGLCLLLARWAALPGPGARAALHLPLLALLGSLLVFPFEVRQVNELTNPITEVVQQQQALAGFLTPESWPFAAGDRVYFIAADTTNYELLAAAYHLYPIRCDAALGHNLHTGAGYDTWASEVSAEALAAELAENYTYLYLYAADGSFYENYASLFGGAENIANRVLYAVQPQPGGGVLLQRVWPG